MAVIIIIIIIVVGPRNWIHPRWNISSVSVPSSQFSRRENAITAAISRERDLPVKSRGRIRRKGWMSDVLPDDSSPRLVRECRRITCARGRMKIARHADTRMAGHHKDKDMTL